MNGMDGHMNGCMHVCACACMCMCMCMCCVCVCVCVCVHVECMYMHVQIVCIFIYLRDGGLGLGVRKLPLSQCCHPGKPRRQESLTLAPVGLSEQAAHRAELREAAEREIALLRDHKEGAEPALANEVWGLAVHLAILESLLGLCMHVLWWRVARWGRRVLRWRVAVWCR